MNQNIVVLTQTVTCVRALGVAILCPWVMGKRDSMAIIYFSVVNSMGARMPQEFMRSAQCNSIESLELKDNSNLLAHHPVESLLRDPPEGRDKISQKLHEHQN